MTLKRICGLALGLSALCLMNAPAHAAAPWETQPGSWVASDALGRELPMQSEAGAPRANRQVGIFYFTWLSSQSGPWDIGKILQQDPGAMSNPSSPFWGGIPAFHHWGESLFGYYVSTDGSVIRKHAQMLSDAGVDTLILDATNGFTYKPSYMALLETYRQMRAEGNKTPQMLFLCQFGNAAAEVRELYDDLYTPDLITWEAANHLAPLTQGGGVLTAVLTGSDPYMHSPNHLNIDTRRHNRLRLRMKNVTGGGPGQLFWRTAADPGWNQTQSRAFSVSANDAAFQDYEIDLSSSAAWTGTVLEVRLDPVAGVGSGTVEIERIELAGADSSVEPIVWTFDGNPYAELFFPWQGRPLILANPANLSDPELLNFFTFRRTQPDYQAGPSGPDQWAWLEIYPQHRWLNSAGELEMMPVGVSQNALEVGDGTVIAPQRASNPGTRGNAFWKGAGAPAGDGVLEGHNFKQQWDRALAEDPPFIFVTGWNEWIAQRFSDAEDPVFFVDAFDVAHNRDCEPSKSIAGDNYYYQLIANIRRYKGVEAVPRAYESWPIAIDGDFADWTSVTPEFRDDRNDQVFRNHEGWGSAGQYVNTTGRNDLLAAKVTQDDQAFYFYVRNNAALTVPAGDAEWMNLWIDADGNPATGWNGYDLRINRQVAADEGSIEAHAGNGFAWNATGQTAQLSRAGDALEVAVPRALIPGGGAGAPYHIDFKWTDNVQATGDIMEFTLNGDAAPNDRYNYRYLFNDNMVPVEVSEMRVD